MKALVEERGGVVLDKASGADAEHAIRLDELNIFYKVYNCTTRLLVRTELPPNRSFDLFKYR